MCPSVPALRNSGRTFISERHLQSWRKQRPTQTHGHPIVSRYLNYSKTLADDSIHFFLGRPLKTYLFVSVIWNMRTHLKCGARTMAQIKSEPWSKLNYFLFHIWNGQLVPFFIIQGTNKLNLIISVFMFNNFKINVIC